MDKSKLMIYMHNPELLGDRNLPEIREMVDEYPFFQSARMLYVKILRNQGYSNYGKALRETAVFVTNRTKLFFLLDERVIIKHDAEPTQREAEEEVFDFAKMAQLAGLVDTAQSAKKQAKLAASVDYFGNLSDAVDFDNFRQAAGKKNKAAGTPQTKEDRHASLLDNFKGFNLKRPTIEELKEPQTDGIDLSGNSSTAAPDLLSETLADIYFKTGAYDKALNMYENLCLKYPEKNAYFTMV